MLYVEPADTPTDTPPSLPFVKAPRYQQSRGNQSPPTFACIAACDVVLSGGHNDVSDLSNPGVSSAADAGVHTVNPRTQRRA